MFVCNGGTRPPVDHADGLHVQGGAAAGKPRVPDHGKPRVQRRLRSAARCDGLPTERELQGVHGRAGRGMAAARQPYYSFDVKTDARHRAASWSSPTTRGTRRRRRGSTLTLADADPATRSTRSVFRHHTFNLDEPVGADAGHLRRGRQHDPGAQVHDHVPRATATSTGATSYGDKTGRTIVMGARRRAPE